MGLDPSLLEILACPHCLSEVSEEGTTLRCANDACGLKFAVEDGIPNMLIDDADRACPSCGAARTYDGRVLRCDPCKKEVVDPRPPAGDAARSGA
jgi:uncharacterized protein